ncbi:MAG: hypothetical protein ACI9UA_003849 [Pseudoalteromonas tetraodonis]
MKPELKLACWILLGLGIVLAIASNSLQSTNSVDFVAYLDDNPTTNIASSGAMIGGEDLLNPPLPVRLGFPVPEPSW